MNGRSECAQANQNSRGLIIRLTKTYNTPLCGKNIQKLFKESYITKNAAARLCKSECKQLNIHLYASIQMYLYPFTFQSDENIILLPYKKKTFHSQKSVPLHSTFKNILNVYNPMIKYLCLNDTLHRFLITYPFCFLNMASCDTTRLLQNPLQNYNNRFGLTRGKVSNLGQNPTKVPKPVQSAQITALSAAQNCTSECPYPRSILQTYSPGSHISSTTQTGTSASAPSAMARS